MWEKMIDINEVREIRVKTTSFLGVGAIQKMHFIAAELKKMGADKVIVVTGKAAYKKTGAWDVVVDAFEKENITYKLYDQVTPNPETHQVNAAVDLAKSFDANAVLAIGGGSPVDAAKAVAVLLAYPEKNADELCNLTFPIEKAVPIVAINLTHGTGTEVDRFSVVTIPETQYKPALAADCMYPIYAIDDPALMVGLPNHQTTYVSVDALNHVIEAATTIITNPLSILLAEETVRLIAKYLPNVQKDPNDLEARYYLTYASLIAGTSFDNGCLHFTHAMEHPLSGMKTETIHGLGLAILLPSVVKHIYDATKDTLFYVLKPILGDLAFETASNEDVAKAVRLWLESVGITEKLGDIGFTIDDIDELTRLAFETPGLDGLLSLAPIKADQEVVKTIYRESF